MTDFMTRLAETAALIAANTEILLPLVCLALLILFFVLWAFAEVVRLGSGRPAKVEKRTPVEAYRKARRR